MHTGTWILLVLFYGPLYLAGTCSVLVLPEERWWILLGDDFWIYSRIQLCLVRQLQHVCVSLQKPGGFHAFLREGGPRILILRLIPSCLRLPEAFGSVSTCVLMKVDSLLRSTLVLLAVWDTRSCVSLWSLLDEFHIFPDEGGLGS